jgi:hypothetical protein
VDKIAKGRAEKIRAFLGKVVESNDTALTVPVRKSVGRMLMAVYANQTSDERAIQATKHSNGVGFNGYDAIYLSDVAERSKNYNSLTTRQTRSVAKSLRKYAVQIAMATQ